MPSNTMKTLAIGGGIAALTALTGTAALAQTTETVIVPAPALEAASPVGAVTESAIPILEQIDNDQAVAETLIAQGFTDVHILREGALMTVAAQRAGEPIELVYSVANGSLVSIDGQELRRGEENSSAADQIRAGTDTAAADEAATDGTEDGTTDDGMSDDAGTGDDDGSDDSATDTGEAGDGGSASDGSDASDGADGTGEAGSDSGGAGDGDSGSDGGSDAGGESDSDGGTNG